MSRFANFTKTILLSLLIGGAILFVLSSTAGTRKLLKGVGRELRKRDQRRRFLQTLAYLRRKKYISYIEEKDGSVKIVLTEGGKKRALRYKLETMALPKTKKWDGKWRIIAFDIPEEKKAARNALREKMQSLGMVFLQKSLWAWPYECKDEIDFIAEVFGVGRYVHYIVAESITSEDYLKHNFDLS